MPRIAELSLQQVNHQVDLIDQLHKRLNDLHVQLNNISQQVAVTDPYHAPATTNNIAFTWTGATNTLSWAKGYLKSKNWNAQIVSNPPIKSSAPGAQHLFAVAAGSLVLLPSTYYWMGWSPNSQTMQANINADVLHSNHNVHVICQLYTGTAGQTGTAGGGGNSGGSDLSGARYKNF